MLLNLNEKTKPLFSSFTYGNYGTKKILELKLKKNDIYKNSNPFVYITIYFYEKKPRTRNCVFLYIFFSFFNWCLLYFVVSAGTLCWWYWSNYNFFFFIFCVMKVKNNNFFIKQTHKKGFLFGYFLFF